MSLQLAIHSLHKKIYWTYYVPGTQTMKSWIVIELSHLECQSSFLNMKTCKSSAPPKPPCLVYFKSNPFMHLLEVALPGARNKNTTENNITSQSFWTSQCNVRCFHIHDLIWFWHYTVKYCPLPYIYIYIYIYKGKNAEVCTSFMNSIQGHRGNKIWN